MPLQQTAGQHRQRRRSHVSGHAVSTVALLAAVLLPWPAHGQAPAKHPVVYGRLPLVFEANAGQTDPAVKFLSRGPGYTLFLTHTEAVLPSIPREPLQGSQPRHHPKTGSGAAIRNALGLIGLDHVHNPDEHGR